MTNKDYIKMLKERDTPMAMTRYIPVSEGCKPWDTCPACGRSVLMEDSQFCDLCGQRFDRENYQF